MSKIFFSDADESVLQRLLNYFSSSYSSDGKLKLVQTIDCSMSVYTSRSSRLIAQLKCHRSISRLFIAGMTEQLRQHHDGALFYGIIFARFLLELRRTSIRLTELQTLLHRWEDFQLPHVTIDFRSIQPLLALVRAVICKPLAYDYSSKTREELCLLTVKSFLENVTSTNEDPHLLTIEGLPMEYSKLFRGLLYPIYSPKSSLCSSRSRPCLYFSISLAGDYTMEDLDTIQTSVENFQWSQTVADRLSEQILRYTQLHHGGLILCQKVIHPTIKKKLKQWGIDTIDRLSRPYTPYFCSITGCRPIETLNIDRLNQCFFGTISSIEQIDILEKKFLLFTNEHRSFHSLLLCSITEQSLLELKECVTASHQILNKTLTTKKAFFGAGCSESLQIFHLRQQIPSIGLRCLLRTLTHLLRSQYSSDLVIDRAHGHLWFLTSDRTELSTHCACQIYQSTELFQNQWHDRVLFLDDGDEQVFKLKDQICTEQSSAKFLDSYTMKSQTMKTAIETAINLYLTNVYL